MDGDPSIAFAHVNYLSLTGCWLCPTLALYGCNMPKGQHPKKEIRTALDDAVAAGLEVKDTSAHGHSWGYIFCAKCGQRFSVYSTPKNVGNHANQIRRFILRHRHEDLEGLGR